MAFLYIKALCSDEVGEGGFLVLAILSFRARDIWKLK